MANGHMEIVGKNADDNDNQKTGSEPDRAAEMNEIREAFSNLSKKIVGALDNLSKRVAVLESNQQGCRVGKEGERPPKRIKNDNAIAPIGGRQKNEGITVAYTKPVLATECIAVQK